MSEYKKGAQDAAELAAQYPTTHPYRLDDCILAGLNLSSRKKLRKNLDRVDNPNDEWIRGYSVALAEIRRATHDDLAVVQCARIAGITLNECRRLKLSQYDLSALKSAGVKK